MASTLAQDLARRSKTYFQSKNTRTYESRIAALTALKASLQQHESEIFDALWADLHKCKHEAYPAELGLVYAEISEALSELHVWMAEDAVSTPLALMPGSSFVRAEPLGSALIIAPWNYPLQLALCPLVGAIAAGCTAVLKPSELSAATSGVIERICTTAFPKQDWVQVATGGPEVSQSLLLEAWDVIFFTGSTRVGKLVYQAAAQHLTPVVLELGGKSPCIVDTDVNMDVAARRIAWAKTYNAGQTCVAPDYVLLLPNTKAQFVECFQKSLRAFYGEHAEASSDYGRIINDAHFQRLTSLLPHGRAVVGGQANAQSRFIAPTLLDDVALDSPLMTEEIFGPLLPMLEVPSIEAAIDFVNARPKPLSLYVFSDTKAHAQRILNETSSGSAVVNDAVVQVASGQLPFGGVGASGMGRYHGKASFDAFSHHKSVLQKPFLLDLKVRYPPYSNSLWLMKQLVK
jgi:aldehyde dehydrogenase (NAD+)